MRKYLNQIKTTGIILMIVGILMYRVMGIMSGYIVCGIGIALWIIEVVYKAVHWNEYQKDNRQNNIQMLIIIMLLISAMFLVRCQ